MEKKTMNKLATIANANTQILLATNTVLSIDSSSIETVEDINATVAVLNTADRYFENVRCWLFGLYVNMKKPKGKDLEAYAMNAFGWKKASAFKKKAIAKRFFNGSVPRTVFAKSEKGVWIDFPYTVLDIFNDAKLTDEDIKALLENGKITLLSTVAEVKKAVTPVKEVVAEVEAEEAEDTETNTEEEKTEAKAKRTRYTLIATAKNGKIVPATSEPLTFEEVASGRAVKESEAENGKRKLEAFKAIINGDSITFEYSAYIVD